MTALRGSKKMYLPIKQPIEIHGEASTLTKGKINKRNTLSKTKFRRAYVFSTEHKITNASITLLRASRRLKRHQRWHQQPPGLSDHESSRVHHRSRFGHRNHRHTHWIPQTGMVVVAMQQLPPVTQKCTTRPVHHKPDQPTTRRRRQSLAHLLASR